MAVKIGNAKISNSYRGMRFEVTRSDIKNGQPNDPCNCAAARGLRRHFDAKEVFVFRDVTYIVSKDGKALRFHTPPALRLETIIFDRNGEFYPGEYDLEPAPAAVKKVAGGKSKSKSESKRRNSTGPRRSIPNVRPTASQRLAKV